MSSPARSDGAAALAVGSAPASHPPSGNSVGAVESNTASGPSAVPPLPSSSAPSSASAQPALMPAVSVGPSVTVEDECTKRCSVCGEDRPVSAYSSAQLKKKGKRVCASCVAAKDLASSAAAAASSAAARLESMRPAFVSKLSACAPRAAAPCRGCRSKHSRLAQCDRCKTELCSVQCFDKHPCDANLTFEAKISVAKEQPAAECPCCGKQTTRLAACVRCCVECCSLKCFDQHDCDTYLEAKRTMPTELIPEEDRFSSADEILASWKELFEYLCSLPASVSQRAVEDCAQPLNSLVWLDSTMLAFVETLRLPLRDLYSPRVSRPWWNPAASVRLRYAADPPTLIAELLRTVLHISHFSAVTLEACATTLSFQMPGAPDAFVRGDWLPVPTIDCASPCFLPGRLTHKLLTLLRWILRTMGSGWTQAHFEQPGDVSSDAFGLLLGDRDAGVMQVHLGYLELPSPNTGLCTLVPLFGTSSASSPRFHMLRQHLGQRMLSMILRDGELLLDRGLHLNTTNVNVEMIAVSGWTGNVMDSFSVAPAHSLYFHDEWLLRYVTHSSDSCWFNEELEARKRPDYFHLILAIKQLIPVNEWPSTPEASLFIATPQLGIECELVELSLLESLVEDAAAGNEQAQLLLTHIESECAAPISEVISAQKSRLAQMLEDQAAQLRIHAEAVKRAEMRGRLRGSATADEDGADASTASASVSSSSASALAPTSAASSAFSSSSSSSSLLAADSAVSTTRASSSVAAPAYSWTHSREYAGLESLRAPGRKKYSTIMSAAKRLLYSLSPVSVNKRAGSHIVFHFASGAPATLVQKHAGARSKDSTAHTTRLFAQLSEVAMQQGMAGASSIEGASEAGREGAVSRLLN